MIYNNVKNATSLQIISLALTFI